jgi:hypothetical protein
MSTDREKAMLAVVEDCVKKNKLDLLSKILCDLQSEYHEVCRLSTDGAYEVTWSHKDVLDYLTYNQKY